MITADFGYGFISYIGNFLLQNRLNVGFFMSRFILPEVVYTALVSLLIYHPIHYFCVITEQGKERKKKGKIDEGSIEYIISLLKSRIFPMILVFMF